MLSRQQHHLLNDAKKNGSVLQRERLKYYSTEASFVNAINRLIVLGYLKQNEKVLGKFDWTGKNEYE